MVLTKFRLSVTVVLSGLLGYLFGADFASFDGVLPSLCLYSQACLITFCANAFNEIIEKDTDLLMDRTKERPLPTGAMTVSEALIAAGVMGVLGLLILWLKVQFISSCFGSYFYS
jgi:protoheme IX farnesyltransferase